MSLHHIGYADDWDVALQGRRLKKNGLPIYLIQLQAQHLAGLKSETGKIAVKRDSISVYICVLIG